MRHHAAVRTLVLTIFIFNITFGAAWSVLVLYATRAAGARRGRLRAHHHGQGGRRPGRHRVLRLDHAAGEPRRTSCGSGWSIETLTHLALALTTTPWVAMPVFFVFGAHAFIWGTTSVTVRQRAVPTELQGRVGSVNLVGVYGGLVIGSAIGGVLAQHSG